MVVKVWQDKKEKERKGTQSTGLRKTQGSKGKGGIKGHTVFRSSRKERRRRKKERPHPPLYTSTHRGVRLFSESQASDVKKRCQVRRQVGLRKIKVPFKFY